MDLQVQSKFDVLYQIRKTVFQHISKHKEESWKYIMQQSSFDDLQMWPNSVQGPDLKREINLTPCATKLVVKPLLPGHLLF